MLGGIICRFHVLGYGPLSTSGGITVLTATSKVLLLLCAFAVTGSIHLEYCIVIPCIYIFNSFLCLLFLLKNCVNETLLCILLKIAACTPVSVTTSDYAYSIFAP